jgi:tRNA A37 threonylcarbamoyltransferase TsaD
VLEAEATAAPWQLHLAPPALCTDNAAMVAAQGQRLLATGRLADLATNATSAWTVAST